MKQTLTDWKIGFIGLGLMGRPMCSNLHRAGAQLVVFNRTHAVAESMSKEGMEAVTQVADVASACDLIIIMTSDTASVQDVLFGSEGLVKHLQPNSLVIDMGTTAVTATRDFARRVSESGSAYIDAPVSGGEVGAIQGDLVIMAGGTSESIERAQPLFDVLGKATVHIGDVGTGQVAKAANQVIVGLNVEAVAEAFTLARHAGADLVRVREALMGGFAASRILELHGQRMIDQDYTPGARLTTQYKDMSQAIDLAAEFGQKLPATELNRTLHKQLIESGHGDVDQSGIILAMQNYLDHPTKDA